MPELVELSDPSRPSWSAAGSRPVPVWVWRPARSALPPLVLFSHGNAGHAGELAWLAEPLVASGFAVAAVEHHGATSAGELLPEGFAFGWERARDLTFVVDRLDGVDRNRVGAVGNSAGAFAAALLVGARLDVDLYRAVLDGSIDAPIPEFPDLRQRLERYAARREQLITAATGSHADPRVKAAFLLAPVLGELVDADSLRGIDRPVAIRWGDADEVAPPPSNALRYAGLIPGADARSLGAGCGHLEFSGDVADPLGVREQVAAEVVAVLAEHVAAAGAGRA